MHKRITADRHHPDWDVMKHFKEGKYIGLNVEVQIINILKKSGKIDIN